MAEVKSVVLTTLWLSGSLLLQNALATETEADENLIDDPYEHSTAFHNVSEEIATPLQLKKAVNNFGCKVNDMKLNLLMGTDTVIPPPDTVTPDELRGNIGPLHKIDWVHIGQHHFSDIDGRHSDRIIATPGGDLGEFLNGLAAFEDLTEERLSLQNVTDYLISFLKHTTKVHFYFSTSDTALDWLTNVSSCGDFDIANPNEAQKVKLMEYIVDPKAIGNLHFQNLLKDPFEYRIRAQLVRHAIRAFHLVMWDQTLKERRKLSYVLLEGDQFTERGWVNVYTSEMCIDEGLAPMLYTHDSCIHWRTMYINHIHAVSVFRKAIAGFFGAGDAPLTRGLEWQISEKGIVGFAKTAAVAFKRPYPFYEVTMFWNQTLADKNTYVDESTGTSTTVVQSADHIKYYPATRSVEESQTNLADATKLSIPARKSLKSQKLQKSQ